MGGREYVSREELVAEIERRFKQIEGMQNDEVDHLEVGDEVGATRPQRDAGARAGRPVQEETPQAVAGARPKQPRLHGRPPSGPVSRREVVKDRDARHHCSWCARHSPNPLPPLEVVHKRSAIDTTIFLCATCSGSHSTVWRMFRRSGTA